MVSLVEEFVVFFCVELRDVGEANLEHFEHVVDYEAGAHQLVLELRESLDDLLLLQPSPEANPNVEHDHSVDSHIC